MVSKLPTISGLIATSFMMATSFFNSNTLNLFLGVVDDPKVHAQLNCTAWMTVHTSDISFQLTGRQAYFEVRSEMLWGIKTYDKKLYVNQYIYSISG